MNYIFINTPFICFPSEMLRLGRLDYLKQYSSTSTVKTYKSALRCFFKIVYNRGDDLEALAERYFSEERNHQEDVQNLLVNLKESAPYTVRLYLSALKIFLMENDVELNPKFWRKIRGRIKGSRALTLDKVPSNEELRRILTHLPVQGKALFLMLASSGMRIGEALQLKLEDLEMENDPVQVSIRGEYTKTGNPRVAFMSREAKEVMQEWLKNREKYLETAVKKSKLYEKQVEDSRVFPFENTTAYTFWNKALGKAKFKQRDKETNRHRIHPHVLRKFFRTKMGSVISPDVVEALIGHEEYLTAVYRKHSVEDLADFYKQGEHSILVFTDAGEVTKLRKEVKDHEKQLQTLVNNLATENIDLKGRVEKQETRIKELEKLKEQLKKAEQKRINDMEEVKNMILNATGIKIKYLREAHEKTFIDTMHEMDSHMNQLPESVDHEKMIKT